MSTETLSRPGRLGRNGDMPATRVRFADPTRCPDCSSQLPDQPDRCPVCKLPLQGPAALNLLQTLRTADALLAELRASVEPSPVPALTPYPMPQARPASPARSGLQTASIPKILLGLGATCLLVAAVIFLAVAWSWLGIGGRTVVLIGLTAASGAGGAWLGRRGLTLAAEALTSVSLGLLVIDADDAGWLGVLDVTDLWCVIGAVLTAVSLALLMAPRPLVVPQLSAPFGLVVLAGGLSGQTDHYQSLAAGAVLAFGALVAFGRVRRAHVLVWAAAAGAALAWVALGALALLDALAHPTLRELWLERHGWGLVTGAALSLLVLGVDRSAAMRRVAVAFVLSALTFVVALPGLDEGTTRATVVAVVATMAWAVAAAVVPPRWSAVPWVPLLGSALLPAIVAAALFLRGVGNLGTAGSPFSGSYDIRLDPGPALAAPVLLPVSVLALILAAGLALPRSRVFRWWAPAVLLSAGVGTLALYPLPLWTVLLPAAIAAIALVVDGLRRSDDVGAGEAMTAGALLVAVAVLALPSAHLATIALTVLVLGSLAVLVRGRFRGAQEMAGAVLPVAVASLLWTAEEVLGTDQALRAAPTLLVLGVMALIRPRPEVELSAAAGVFVAAVAAIPRAEDVSVSLAVHLTVAGVLVTASALVNPERRALGWLGGALLAAATWVRLYDIGVVAPEAYTLPSAVALLLVGLRRLHTVPTTPTMAALAPGLVLGTVPSLMWVLEDPVTVRAALLGVACLVLLLAGVQLRWNAPVVVGAVVGGLVVLRELAPYAAQTPPWVVIGLAGAVLITAGVTWEARMRDLQQASAYLGRLR
jgi:hypothetical protein